MQKKSPESDSPRSDTSDKKSSKRVHFYDEDQTTQHSDNDVSLDSNHHVMHHMTHGVNHMTNHVTDDINNGQPYDVYDYEKDISSTVMDKDEEDEEKWDDWDNDTVDDNLDESVDELTLPNKLQNDVEDIQSYESTSFISDLNVSSKDKSKSEPSSTEIIVEDGWNSNFLQTRSVENERAAYSDIKSSSAKKEGKSGALLLKTQKKPKTNNNPLGSEFDIKGIEIEKLEKQVEVIDFFADMQPEIKPTTKSDGPELQSDIAKDKVTKPGAGLVYKAEEQSTTVSMLY